MVTDQSFTSDFALTGGIGRGGVRGEGGQYICKDQSTVGDPQDPQTSVDQLHCPALAVGAPDTHMSILHMSRLQTTHTCDVVVYSQMHGTV